MEKVKFWRLERGLTQFDLQNATEGRVSRWAIQLIEQGLRLPTDTEVTILSRVLGVDPRLLLPAENKKGGSKSHG